MKTKLTILLCALAGTVHATLIDLTPGGFDFHQPLPTVVSNFFGQYGLNMQNIAGFNIVNGQPAWSPFTVFGSDHFSLSTNALGTGADVDWDLSGTGFHLRFVLAESSDLISHLYAVPGKEQITGDGFITIDGNIPLIGGVFAGSNETPDTGSTLALMGVALVTLFFLHRRMRKKRWIKPMCKTVPIFFECTSYAGALLPEIK